MNDDKYLLKESIISISALLNSFSHASISLSLNEVNKDTIDDIRHEIEKNIEPLLKNIKITSADNNFLIEVDGPSLLYSAYQVYYVRIDEKDVVLKSSKINSFLEKKKEERTKKIKPFFNRTIKSTS